MGQDALQADVIVVDHSEANGAFANASVATDKADTEVSIFARDGRRL